MAWVVEPCDREGCPGFWAWRCPTGRHGAIDDTLELAAHGLSHDLRAREVLVEGLHSCRRCGSRDWEAGGRWAPGNLQTIRFLCCVCGYGLPVTEFVLYSLEQADRGAEVARPAMGEPPRPCGCGQSAVYAGDNGDWPGAECACCGGTMGLYGVANWARPLCPSCDGRTPPPPQSPPPQSPGTACWAW